MLFVAFTPAQARDLAAALDVDSPRGFELAADLDARFLVLQPGDLQARALLTEAARHCSNQAAADKVLAAYESKS